MSLRHHSPQDRRTALQADDILGFTPALPEPVADGMIENVIGTFELPLGVVPDFPVNGKTYNVPMAVEEPSVVAAAAHMGKIARAHGGFRAETTDPLMRAQVQILGLTAPGAARDVIMAAREELIAAANACDPVLVSLGGGCRDVEVHLFQVSPAGPMVVAHLIVDVRDAMGANTVNTMAERLAPRFEALTGGTVRLRILSNLADLRLARASVILPGDAFDPGVTRAIAEACALAIVDPYRAATHNKGIMNGIDPLVIATGNDWRAIESGAHAYAARSGRYVGLTTWEAGEDGVLTGQIELPMALGLVGGATGTHPQAQAALKLMGISSAADLAKVAAAVGLAQNLAALRALASEGIQKGHMALHARNIAILAGAHGADVDRVAKGLALSGAVTVEKAKELLGA